MGQGVEVLFRAQPGSEEELSAARSVFPVKALRSRIEPGSLVIARYSALPNYRELEGDLETFGSRLINSAAQHDYIASLAYAADLGELTFQTWHEFHAVPRELRDQPFVVKGKANSKKFEWATKMFAKDFAAAVRVGAELMTDSMIAEQGVVIRRHHELEIFETGVTGMPMANEWRLFFHKERLLADGFYWAILDDMSPVERARPEFEASGRAFARKCAAIIAKRAEFFAIDIAKTASGEWICVEVNDGQMSGLNDSVDPMALYGGLKSSLELEAQALARANATQAPSRPARGPGGPR